MTFRAPFSLCHDNGTSLVSPQEICRIQSELRAAIPAAVFALTSPRDAIFREHSPPRPGKTKAQSKKKRNTRRLFVHQTTSSSMIVTPPNTLLADLRSDGQVPQLWAPRATFSFVRTHSPLPGRDVVIVKGSSRRSVLGSSFFRNAALFGTALPLAGCTRKFSNVFGGIIADRSTLDWPVLGGFYP